MKYGIDFDNNTLAYVRDLIMGELHTANNFINRSIIIEGKATRPVSRRNYVAILSERLELSTGGILSIELNKLEDMYLVIKQCEEVVAKIKVVVGTETFKFAPYIRNGYMEHTINMGKGIIIIPPNGVDPMLKKTIREHINIAQAEKEQAQALAIRQRDVAEDIIKELKAKGHSITQVEDIGKLITEYAYHIK